MLWSSRRLVMYSRYLCRLRTASQGKFMQQPRTASQLKFVPRMRRSLGSCLQLNWLSRLSHQRSKRPKRFKGAHPAKKSQTPSNQRRTQKRARRRFTAQHAKRQAQKEYGVPHRSVSSFSHRWGNTPSERQTGASPMLPAASCSVGTKRRHGLQAPAASLARALRQDAAPDICGGNRNRHAMPPAATIAPVGDSPTLRFLWSQRRITLVLTPEGASMQRPSTYNAPPNCTALCQRAGPGPIRHRGRRSPPSQHRSLRWAAVCWRSRSSMVASGLGAETARSVASALFRLRLK